ncbi:MAG: cytochrome c oxidase accessory protein CcoG [Luteolibacter sp.]|uniref:cytochrome c oxidase accessory protein CcoG n=1 Tax=Luteolibacter sp. TaxID=1962973 RepID=UPI003263E352
MSALKQPNLVSVTTINDDGSRYFLHPADVKGPWNIFRRFVGVLLIAVYVLLPWIPINGNPAVFLDVENRMFHLFGLTLVPQDLWVMFFAISGLGFVLFFATSLLGRVWCGWACPYTVFLDHVYRRIERWIEGDAPARRALEKAPWTAGKISKRLLKHFLFAAIAAAIAHVFLSYFVSLGRLYDFMQEGPLQHVTAFGIVLFLTLVLWFCFGYFREQFCIIMCPYGRLQSALTDDDTVNVGYDEKRGEPRGAKGKAEGDCIDCRRCVQVCPTGIDIRNGLQLECIGCTACIDACDDIMTKVDRPKGLIRYDSFNGFAGKKRRYLRPRVYAYCALAGLGLAALILVASNKARPFIATISRAGGAGFFSDDASVRNIYKVRVFNKRNQTATVTIHLGKGTPAGYQLSGADQSFSLPALSEMSRTCVVFAPLASYVGTSDIVIEVHADPGDVILKKTARFLGPNPQSIQHPNP